MDLTLLAWAALGGLTPGGLEAAAWFRRGWPESVRLSEHGFATGLGAILAVGLVAAQSTASLPCNGWSAYATGVALTTILRGAGPVVTS